MTTYYNHNPKFYVGIDCIIFGFDKGELNIATQKKFRACNGTMVADGRLHPGKRKCR